MNPIFFFNREITPVRKLLMLHAVAGGGAGTEYTETGNPLTFLTDLAKPLKSCLATWQPHQSGTGDPSPENIRPVLGMDGVNVWHGDKNLFDASAVVRKDGWLLDDNGREQPTTQSGYTQNRTSVKEGATYTINGTIVKGAESCRLYFYTGDTFVSRTSPINVGAFPYTFTVPVGCDGVAIQYNMVTFDPSTIQIELGETATAYEPYSGTSYSVAFPVLGKNLLDINVFSRNGITASKVDGKAVLSGTAEGSAYNVEFVRQTLQAGTYTASISGLETGMECVITKDGQWYRSLSSATTFTLTGDALIGGYVRTSDGTEIDATVAIMLEQGSSSTPYEPYTRTCYGGTLDLTTGVLTADFAVISKKWSDFEVKGGAYGYENRTLTITDDVLDADHGGGIAGNHFCNCMIYQYATASAETNHYFINSSKTIAAYMADGTSENTDIVILAKLATPQTFQLTPTQISALIGNNTMWADADDLSVTYLKKG